MAWRAAAAAAPTRLRLGGALRCPLFLRSKTARARPLGHPCTGIALPSLRATPALGVGSARPCRCRPRRQDKGRLEGWLWRDGNPQGPSAAAAHDAAHSDARPSRLQAHTNTLHAHHSAPHSLMHRRRPVAPGRRGFGGSRGGTSSSCRDRGTLRAPPKRDLGGRGPWAGGGAGHADGCVLRHACVQGQGQKRNMSYVHSAARTGC